MTPPQTREPTVPTEQRGPCTFSHLCPKSTCNSSFNFARILLASEDCTFGTSAAAFLLRWSHVPLAHFTLPHLPSLSPEPDTRVSCDLNMFRLPERSLLCAECSTAVTKSGYRSQMHMMYALNLKYHSCHLAPSPQQTNEARMEFCSRRSNSHRRFCWQ